MQNKTTYTIEKILDLEYQIDISIKWLKSVNMGGPQKQAIIEDVLQQLWLNYQTYSQLIPSNPYQHQIYTIFHPLDTKKYPNFSNIQKTIVDKNHNDTFLSIASTANKIRIDTNVAMALVRYFIPFSNHLPYNLKYWKLTAETLSTLGICIPFTSILLVTYQLYQKIQMDNHHANAREYLLFFHQKQYQIFKNFLVILLNLSSIIVSYYQLFEARFYFSFLSICIDYLFYLIEYDQLNKQLHHKEMELYINLLEKVPGIKNPHQLLHEDKIYQSMSLYQQYPNSQLNIIELIINHQQQIRIHDGFILECIAMLFMLTTMVIPQQTGLIEASHMLLIGLISSYFYNVLKPYLIDFIIEYRHQETIELIGPNQEKIAIKLGEIHNGLEKAPSAIKSYTFYSLMAKCIAPCVAILLSELLTPTSIMLMLAVINSVITLLEAFCKNTPKENLAIKPP
jgi:hypothetical protein